MNTLDQAKELFLTALQHQNQGELEQAESLYRKALELAPDRPSVINNLAAVLLQLKRYGEAKSWCEKLLAQDPGNVIALLNFGNCRLLLHSAEEALKSYDDALAIDPRHVEALNSRSKALMDLGRPAEALASCDQALAIQPDRAEVLSNRGGALEGLNRHAEALASYDRAVAVNPDYAEAYYNRGNVLRNLTRYQEALASYGRALTIKPDYVEAHWNESLCRLLIGDFAKGWEKHEWRWRNEQGRITRRDFPQPLWDGKYVDGVLLAWGEQGLGEQILHAGMLDELCRRARRLVVEVDPRLVNLFRRSFPAMEVVAQRGNYGAIGIDVHVPMGSIGRYFRNRWEDFPLREAGYLIPDGEFSIGLRKRLAGNGRLVVGLSWFSKMNRVGEDKSVPLREFGPILRLSGTGFVDLQYGDTRDERSAVAKLTSAQLIHVDEVDNELDIDGLAALISACDAVVTVSNTTAHIAGAVGKPVYLLLPHALPTHWYWHIDRDRSPWYPTVRLFRQPAAGDWDSVIRRVAEELAQASSPLVGED